MSDFGQIIDPYRVAPAQGSIQDYGQFAQRAEQTQAMRVAAALAEATRAYLSQQQGLPQGVDPMALQGYKGEDQRQMIAGQGNTRANAVEGREAGKYAEANRYAQEFMGGLPQQSDPAMAAAQGAGGVHAVDFISGLLGKDYANKGELANRGAMNDADNVAAQRRLETELTMRGDDAKKTRDATRQENLTDRASQQEYVNQYLKTGDPAHLANVDTRSPYYMDMLGEARGVKATEEEAVKQAAALEAARQLKPNPIGSIQEDPRVRQAEIDKQFPNMSPQQTVDKTIQGTKQFGGDSNWQKVREMYPDLYNQAWNAEQQKMKEQQVLQMIENIKNPRANSLTRTGGY